MSATNEKEMTGFLDSQGAVLMAAWIKLQSSGSSHRRELASDPVLQEQAGRFLESFLEAMPSARTKDVKNAEWAPVRELLAEVTKALVQHGFSASETASFVFSLKRPFAEVLQNQFPDGPKEVDGLLGSIDQILEQLGLLAIEVFQKGREEVILRQQEEMLELSTPW